jgi:transcriptional regulator with XRE-family HTH domain
MAKTYFEELFSNNDNERIYQQESLIVEITETVYELMQRKGMKKKDLAEKLNVSQSQITQLLDGSANMQLRTISDILFTLGSKLKLEIEPLNETFPTNHDLDQNRGLWHDNNTPMNDPHGETQVKLKAA